MRCSRVLQFGALFNWGFGAGCVFLQVSKENGFGMDETREVEARSGFRIWVVVYWVEVACQNTKDDGDGVEEIAVFTVENGGEDELSWVLSVVAIWVVDGRTKELSQWSEAARGCASMEVRMNEELMAALDGCVTVPVTVAAQGAHSPTRQPIRQIFASWVALPLAELTSLAKRTNLHSFCKK
ncbi:hypothetical protein V8G54_034177 [Vigna mungo]|uniref:Uncharacterized protein n=1 Tax=Vigna mungo TaxID=3915 RepID=A0AAQ3MQP3_VIGMU